MLVQAIGALAGAIKAAGLVQGASRGKDKGRAHKWQHRAAPAACCHLLSTAPCGLYIDSIKEDNVIVATSSSKGVEISSGLSSEGETNSSRE